MASNSTIGTLAVNVVARTGKFNKNLAVARTTMGKFTRAMTASTKVVSKYSLEITAVGAATGAVFIKQQLTAVDAIAKTSDKLGISTEGLIGLRFAAEKSGVAADTLDMALQRMTRRLSEAAQGTGESVAALKELGLSAKNLAVLAPDRAFTRIAGAMGKVKNQSDRVRLAFKLFDSEGVALVNTLKLGKTGLEQAAKQAEKLGLVVNRKMAAGIERANDALFELKSVGIGVFRQLTVRAAPAIEAVSKKITELFSNEDRINRFAEAMSKAFVKGFGIVLDAFREIRIGFAAMKADFLGLVLDVKGSQLGGKLLGEVTTKDRFRELSARGAVNRLRDQERPSVAFSRLANNALNFQTGPTAEQLFGGGTTAFDALSKATEGVVGRFNNLLKTPGQIVTGITNNPINQFQVGLFKTLFNNFDPSKLAVNPVLPAPSRLPTLAALEAGTAEAFAASRKNLNPARDANQRLEKINEQQLAVQEGMRVGIEQLVDNRLDTFAIP